MHDRLTPFCCFDQGKRTTSFAYLAARCLSKIEVSGTFLHLTLRTTHRVGIDDGGGPFQVRASLENFCAILHGSESARA
jgi:hypothetical protein